SRPFGPGAPVARLEARRPRELCSSGRPSLGPGAPLRSPPPLWGGARAFHVLTEAATSAPSPLRGGLGRGWIWRITEGPPPPPPPLKGEGSKNALIPPDNERR